MEGCCSWMSQQSLPSMDADCALRSVSRSLTWLITVILQNLISLLWHSFSRLSMPYLPSHSVFHFNVPCIHTELGNRTQGFAGPTAGSTLQNQRQCDSVFAFDKLPVVITSALHDANTYVHHKCSLLFVSVLNLHMYIMAHTSSWPTHSCARNLGL